MEGANGITNWTLGCAEYLPMRIGDIQFTVHAHVVANAPFRLLLGRPFHYALLCWIEDFPSGDVEVSICNPANPSHRFSVPSRTRKVQVASVRILTIACPQLQPQPQPQPQPQTPFRPPVPSHSLSQSQLKSLSLSISRLLSLSFFQSQSTSRYRYTRN